MKKEDTFVTNFVVAMSSLSYLIKESKIWRSIFIEFMADK